MEYTITSYTSPRGNHITVRRPNLTTKEREGRMDTIKQATIQLILAHEKAKRRKT